MIFGTVYLASDFAKLDSVIHQLHKIQSLNDKLFMADTLRWQTTCSALPLDAYIFI